MKHGLVKFDWAIISMAYSKHLQIVNKGQLYLNLRPFMDDLKLIHYIFSGTA